MHWRDERLKNRQISGANGPQMWPKWLWKRPQVTTALVTIQIGAAIVLMVVAVFAVMDLGVVGSPWRANGQIVSPPTKELYNTESK